MRNCILGAIILVAAAIVVGGMTDIVPAVMWEPVIEFFRQGLLLLFASAAWAARALADARPTLLEILLLLLVFYFLTRPQADNH